MNIRQNELNFFIETLRRQQFKGTEIHRLLTDSWGEENVVSLRRVQQIMNEYHQEDRINFKRKAGSGRHRTSTGNENIELVRELITGNNRLTSCDISRQLGIEETAVRRILHKELQLKSPCCKWVPHNLTDENKARRVTCSQEMLNVLSRRNAKQKVIVTDEKWVYFTDTPPKENTRAWVTGAGDRPTLPRRTMSSRKILIMAATNFSKTLTYKEVLHDGGSINAERYLEFLCNMVNHFKQQIPAWEIVLQHDNARPHVACTVRRWLEDQRISLLPQAPYSPDTNLMDRFVFRNYESFRRNINFETSQEIQMSFMDYMDNNLTNAKLSKEFQNLKEHLQSEINADGDYVV